MSRNTDGTRPVTVVLIILGALVAVPLVFMGFGMMGFGSMMDSGGHGMWGGGTAPGWLLLAGFVMQLLFFATIVGGGYLVYRTVTGTESDPDRALEELRLAYARGDLTDEEYEKRREALERDRESGTS
jgi:putative membrane protein